MEEAIKNFFFKVKNIEGSSFLLEKSENNIIQVYDTLYKEERSENGEKIKMERNYEPHTTIKKIQEKEDEKKKGLIKM